MTNVNAFAEMLIRKPVNEVFLLTTRNARA